MHDIQWKQEPVRLFGREIMQPRLTAWYGAADKAYTYSGITMEPLPWTQELDQIRMDAETLAGVSFTSALLNLYRDGSDSIGWHRDNEKMLGPAPVIASVSFGASRKFQFRNYTDKKMNVSLMLGPGSVLVMRGATQRNWEHSLPKTKKLSGARINITFRII
jgi:alkylated DNA repair dioxygenase AlkB